jgi:hypothetical protein
MKRVDGDIDFAAVYPLSRAEIEELPLAGAERELLAAIVAAPVEAAVEGNRSRSGRRRRLGGYAGGLALAASAAIALALMAAGTGGGGSPSPAFGADLVQVAKTSPLVLLDAPGWSVEDVAGVTHDEGEMHFSYRAAEDPIQRAALRWRAGRVTPRTLAGLGASPAVTAAPVLDTRVLALRLSGPPGHRRAAAIWQDGGRVMIFRSTVPDLAAFKKRLGSLRRVGAGAWLRSLPRHLTDRAGAYKEWTRVPAR